MSKAFQWLMVGLSFFIALVAIIVSSLGYFTSQGRSASEIFDSIIGCVVEVKSSDELIGNYYGTGEVYSSDGYILTNAHVVTFLRGGVEYTFPQYFIRFAFEEDYRECALERYDSDLDLAILKLADNSGVIGDTISFGNSSLVQAGEKVYAIGNASKYGIGIFEGIVSIPLINIDYNEITRSVIQCDLTIASGNSGGALVNQKGELIGITTFRVRDSSGNVVYGIAYCIPTNTILDFIYSS